MNSLVTVIKGFIFDKGAKVLAAGGAGFIIIDLFNRISESGEPVKLCIDFGVNGALMMLAGVAVFFAFKSDPPKRRNEYE